MSVKTEQIISRLEPVAETAWWQGLHNLIHKEGSLWWGTRLWWLQLLIWLGVLNGMMLLPLYLMRDLFAAETNGVYSTALEMFFMMAGLAPVVGIIILTQGTIIQEKQLGTAAWILSKPVSRSAFILAKFIANGLGILLTGLLLPGLVAYLLLSLELGAPLALLPFAGAVGMLALQLMFYLSLTLMLGTFFHARGAVLAIALVTLLAGDLVIGFWSATAHVTPWLLPRLAHMLVQGQPLLTPWPMLATAIWTVIFLVAAMWRFGKEEF